MKRDSSVSLSYVLPDWLHARVLPVGLGKELRVLFPAWSVFGCVLILASVGGGDLAEVLRMFVSFCGYPLLGALVFGHEFSHRTMPWLLSQPIARERLWKQKMGLLCLAVLSLAALSLLSVVVSSELASQEGIFRPQSSELYIIQGISVISSILVTPWLTLALRHTLAGAVFSISLPIVILLLSQGVAIGLNYLVLPEDSSKQVMITLFGSGVALLWIVGGILGYRTFMRLESLEGHATVVRLPSWMRAKRAAVTTGESSVRSSPKSAWRNLVTKEIRLQAMVPLVGGLFVLAWAVDNLLAWWTSKLPGNAYGSGVSLLEPASAIYIPFIIIFASVLACAEDRQMGTWTWNLMQPMSARRQWFVKAVVTLLVCLAFTLVLPMSLLWIATPYTDFTETVKEVSLAKWATFVLIIAFASSAIMYIATLFRTTIRAMLWATPLGLVLACLIAPMGETLLNHHNAISSLAGEIASTSPAGAALIPVLAWVPFLLSLLLVLLGALLIHLCSVANFRVLETSVRRLATHLLLFAAATTAAIFLYLEISHWAARGLQAMAPPAEPMPEIIMPPPNPPRRWQMPPSAAETEGGANTSSQAEPPGALPSHLQQMDPAFLRRYGLIAQGTKNNQGASTNTSESSTNRPMMDVQMMRRYGLIPRNTPSPALRPTSQGAFVRSPGRYLLDQAGSTLQINQNPSGVLTLEIKWIEGNSTSSVSPANRLKAGGWFVYPESSQRIWVFDGQSSGILITHTPSETKLEEWSKAALVACPSQVMEALPKEAKEKLGITQEAARNQP